MDSVNKYGSDGVPFTGKVAEIPPPEQQIQQMIDALVPVFQSIIDAISPIASAVKSYVDSFSQLFNRVLELYPDKRVVWLASHHKKARVRKKNQKRIIKFWAKEVKRDDHS